MATIRAWAAKKKGEPLVPFTFDPGPLAADEVEVAVESCGICHSDLSVINNEWGISRYPVVPGHEVIGRVVAVGEHARGLQVGQRVGIGWSARSCMHCRQCLSGDHQLCRDVVATIVGHHGGFAERVRAHWAWCIPIPEGIDPLACGPLLCGGITVFNPLLIHRVRPTDRVAVVGIGGLGHMALKFARAWGCEVTAFSSSPSKYDEARGFGAHHVVSSRSAEDMRRLTGSIDLLLVTVNVPLDWPAMLQTLAPKGIMHVVGAVLEPLAIPAMQLIMNQQQVAGSPTGGPVAISTMLDFAARHQVTPQIERFPMSRVNDALAHLAAGKARYRIVLEADFA